MVNNSNIQSDTSTVAEVYLLHFKRPYWSHAKHYVGYTTKDTNIRIQKHMDGKGSLLVDYAYNKKGIDFEVVMVERFENAKLARYYEKKLKKEGHLARHCKICQELANESKSRA